MMITSAWLSCLSVYPCGMIKVFKNWEFSFTVQHMCQNQALGGFNFGPQDNFELLLDLTRWYIARTPSLNPEDFLISEPDPKHWWTCPQDEMPSIWLELAEQQTEFKWMFPFCTFLLATTVHVCFFQVKLFFWSCCWPVEKCNHKKWLQKSCR